MVCPYCQENATRELKRMTALGYPDASPEPRGIAQPDGRSIPMGIDRPSNQRKLPVLSMPNWTWCCLSRSKRRLLFLNQICRIGTVPPAAHR